MFGNGTGNAGKTVTIANLALIDTDAVESGVSGDNLLTADGWDFWTGEGGAGSLTDKGNGDADIKVDAEGGQVYAVQYTHMLNLTEGETYTLEGDFYCEDDAKVFVHLSKNLRSSLTETDFGALPTVVPPFKEQKEISNYLFLHVIKCKNTLKILII